MQESINLVFANQDDEEAVYSLTTREIAESQKHDIELNTMTDKHGYTTQFVKNTKALCKNGKMVIPKSVQCKNGKMVIVSPLSSTPREHTSRGNSLSLNVLEKSTKDSPIICQKCHSCPVNKCRNHKNGTLPAKLAITIPWEALFVDLIEPYTLKGKDKTVIDLCAPQ